MARDRSPIVKQSRREGVILHPKAAKAIAKGAPIPGQHGQSRRQKPSQFAIQLREKQKVKRMYGLLEKQFARLVKESAKSKGLTGTTLLTLLEKRLDNVVFRSGFALSRRNARQLVTHGHFEVNGQRVDIPSYRVKAGDKITVRKKSSQNNYFAALEEIASAAEETSSSWITADAKKGVVTIKGEPTREDVDANIKEQLIVEYYSR